MQASVEQGAGMMIVTLGEQGSIAWDGRQFWRQAALEVKVVDTMGAGDSYIAGFLCAVANNNSLSQAMEQGTQSAARTIQYHGAW